MILIGCWTRSDYNISYVLIEFKERKAGQYDSGLKKSASDSYESNSNVSSTVS